MSYILDALKKAERERGVTRMPTVLSGQDLYVAPRRRRAVILGGAILLVGIVVWLLLPTLMRLIRQPVPAQVRVDSHQTEPSRPAKAGSVQEKTSIQPTADSPMPSTKVVAPSPPVSEPASAPAAKPIESDRRTVPAIVDTNPPVQVAPAGESAPHTAQSPSQAGGGSQIAPSVESVTPTHTGQAKPASLKEAISKMTLTLISYSDVEGERFVFINGRKYVKGDLVDDLYLIEGITLEGAWLSCQGEKLLLRR